MSVPGDVFREVIKSDLARLVEGRVVARDGVVLNDEVLLKIYVVYADGVFPAGLAVLVRDG